MRLTRAFALLLVAGTVACTAAVPSPSPRPPSPSVVASPLPTANSTPAPSASASPAASVERAGPLGQEIEIGTIDPAFALSVSAFASDGEAVYFGSAGRTPDPNDYTPDLWRQLPSADAPEVVWRNPLRNRTIGVIAGYSGTIVFVDMDADGERDWNLWLIPGLAAEPILLDSHPGDEDVSSLIPSVAAELHAVAWTAFDRGPSGPVSQLLVAEAPEWVPTVLEERDAAVGELWLPDLAETTIVYCEITYNTERTHDERHVYLTDIFGSTPPRQLDTSGRATMPLIVNDGVIWKETDPGFNMFNWGHLVFWDQLDDAIRPISSRLQPDVNFPSAGERFVAVTGYDSAVFEVYDTVRKRWRLIDRYDLIAGEAIFRAQIGGSLLAWLEITTDVAPGGALRWAYLPIAGEDKLRGN
ncbi:MAG TPA: hypothetical protein VFN76_03960 [Candidatus Limnocylindria bacterium]|nr:hypothetical protein [Candidatus Limnocylindria bacterium]